MSCRPSEKPEQNGLSPPGKLELGDKAQAGDASVKPRISSRLVKHCSLNPLGKKHSIVLHSRKNKEKQHKQHSKFPKKNSLRSELHTAKPVLNFPATSRHTVSTPRARACLCVFRSAHLRVPSHALLWTGHETETN